MESFETKTNRRRLTGAYSDKAPAVAFFHPIEEESEITMFSTANRALTFRASMLDVKASRSTQGVQTMVLRGKHTITRACRTEDAALSDTRATAAQYSVHRRIAYRLRICRISSSNCFNAKRRGFPLRFFFAPILWGTRTACAVQVPQSPGAAEKSAAHGHLSTRENQIFLRFTL